MKNKYLPSIAFVLCAYMIVLALVSGIDIIQYSQFIPKESYFKTPGFGGYLNTYFKMIKEYHIQYKNFPQWSDNENVTSKEIAAEKKNNENLITEKKLEIEGRYISPIDNARKIGDKAEVQRLTEKRDQEIQDFVINNTKTEDEIKRQILEEKDDNYNQLKKEIAENEQCFQYYFEDARTGELYTNLKDTQNIEKYIQESALYSIEIPQNSWEVGKVRLHDTPNWIGYLIIPRDIKGFIPRENTTFSQIPSMYNYYNFMRDKVLFILGVFLISLTLAILLLIYIRRKNLFEHRAFAWIAVLWRKIPIDLRTVIFTSISIGIFVFVLHVTFLRFSLDVALLFSLTLIPLTIVALYFIFLLCIINDTYKLLKNRADLKNQWKKSLIYRTKSLIEEIFIVKSIVFKITIVLSLTAVFGVIILFSFVRVLGRSTERFVIISILNILFYSTTVLPYGLRKIAQLIKVIKGTEELALGNLNNAIEVKGKGNLAKLAQNINNMKAGVEKALEGQMKSDRLKSELITNVSHDLKTPLTSIINYVDLLKSENLTQEETRDYISVLDRKTQRLKVLIDDLFEASKVTSGSVELNIEKVDIAALLNQALAEYDEKIKESTLTFRVQISQPKIFVDLDGKKTWRVFENLISNALKYTLPNTRVYITLAEEHDKVVVTIKNISAYEMEFETDEIFERFKRGDKSRNTEGSGLGLAIAKSIVELQGGKLDIEIDGDLFKATVESYR